MVNRGHKGKEMWKTVIKKNKWEISFYFNLFNMNKLQKKSAVTRIFHQSNRMISIKLTNQKVRIFFPAF